MGIRPAIGAGVVAFSLWATGAPACAQEGLPLPEVPASVAASAPPSVVTTGFDPKKDGLPFPNMGDYASPNGNCIGTSIVAIDNFLTRKAREAQGISDPAPARISTNPEQVDFVEEATTSVVQEVAEEKDDTDDKHDTFNPEKPLHDPAPIVAALERIAKTGKPEILNVSSASDGHATVLFGYADGKLQVYDPNYPGKTIEWPFDPKKGLGKNPEASDDPFYAHLRTVGVTPLSQLHTAAQLAAIRKSVAELAPDVEKRYVKVGVSGVATDGTHTRISGRVSGGLKRTFEGDRPPRPSVVWASVGGKPVAHARIAKDGSFHLVLPAAALAGSAADVHLVAMTGEGLLAGYLDDHIESKPSATPGIVHAVGGEKKP
jgi:hypothetical protein